MKILVLNSPIFRETHDKIDKDYLPPLGLGYILSHLKNSKTEVEFLDAVYNKTTLPELIVKLESINPDYIATNIFSTNYLIVKDIIEQFHGSSKFIIGGPAIKNLFSKIIQWQTNNSIDIIIGDGEIITSDIVSDQVKEKPLVETENIRVFLVDRNSIYYNKNISNQRLDRSFFFNEPSLNHYNLKELSIITSRGCIFNCSFCGAARSQNHEFDIRYRTVESITEELTEIQRDYPEVKSIRILDDLFLKSKKSIQQAIQIFNMFNFHWRSMAHIRTFLDTDLSLLTDLKKSGCRELFIGIESGSQRILNMINKNFTVEQIYKSLNNIFKAKIDVKGYFIFGFPQENTNDLEMTYKLASDLKQISKIYQTHFRISVFQFRPYHGTKIYCDLLKNYSEEELLNTEPNMELTKMIGRMQFNFHSKNFSSSDLDTIHEYICRTNALNVSGKLST